MLPSWLSWCTSVKPGSTFQIIDTPFWWLVGARRRGRGSSPSSRGACAAARSGRSRRTGSGGRRPAVRRMSAALAAHRVAGHRAFRRPARRPRSRWAGRLHESGGLEEVVLQHEVLRVGPVVRDVAAGRGGPSRRGWQGAAACTASCRRRPRSRPSSRGPRRPRTPSRRAGRWRCCRDDRRTACWQPPLRGSGRQTPLGMPSAPGKVPKYGVEGPVLLHDHDDVLDLVNAGVDGRDGAGRTGPWPRRRRPRSAGRPRRPAERERFASLACGAAFSSRPAAKRLTRDISEPAG